VKRDLRHVLIFMTALMPVALVATLFTSGATSVRLKVPVRNPVRTAAAPVRAAAREHTEAVDVSLDRRIKLPRPIGSADARDQALRREKAADTRLREAEDA